MTSTCINCGETLAADDVFCGNCGASVPPAAPPRVPAQAPPVPAQASGDPARLASPLSDPGGPGFGRDRVRAVDGGLGRPSDPLPGPPREVVRHEDRRLARTTISGQANLDPLYNTRFQLQLLRQAAVFAGLYLLAGTALLILSVLLLVGGGGLGALKFVEILDGLTSISLAVLFWLLPVPALLAQWSLLLDHKAQAAGTAFEHVTSAFEGHETPLGSIRVKTLRPPGEGRRDYLELHRDDFSGYISCFPHGRDLYVGWTFWIRMSPLRLVLMFIGRRIQNMTGRGDDIHQTLRFESTRAMVAAMHGAVLEGIDNAAGELDPGGPRLLGNGSEFEFKLG